MKRNLVLAICLILVASSVFAQAGLIVAAPDIAGGGCDIYDNGGLVIIYCVHDNTPGATGCRFMLQFEGTTMTYLGEFSPFQAVVGNSHSGISINYGECLASPIHVLTISYFGGNSPPCSMVKILNDPTATPSGIYVTDCTSPVPNRLSAPGVATFINSDGSCRGGG